MLRRSPALLVPCVSVVVLVVVIFDYILEASQPCCCVRLLTRGNEPKPSYDDDAISTSCLIISYTAPRYQCVFSRFPVLVSSLVCW
jgi:hypothetical protein